MEVKAEAKFIRMSPRKARLVADSIKQFSPAVALEQLRFINKAAASPLAKVIASALANAANKKLKTENLKFKKIEVLEGPRMKRWRPVSRGMVHQYKKRTSHIKVILEES